MSISFLQLIHHVLSLHQNELTEPKGKDKHNRGIHESFQKESLGTLAPEHEGFHDKGISTSVLLSIISLVTHPLNISPFSRHSYKCISSVSFSHLSGS